jgi:hypothetical protein
MKTPVWIAISTYVLAAILKRELNIDRSLFDICKISASPCSRKPQCCRSYPPKKRQSRITLSLNTRLCSTYRRIVVKQNIQKTPTGETGMT